MFDQAMTIEDGMDGAFGEHPHVAGKTPDEEFTDLARAPMGFIALESNDQALDLLRQFGWRSAPACGNGR